MKTLKGFTLIELMIVVAIIGILAAVIVPMFSKQEQTYSKPERRTHVREVKTESSASTQPVLEAESIHKISSDGPIFACVEGKLYLNAVSMNKGCDLTLDGISFKP